MGTQNLQVESLGMCVCGRQIYANVERGAVAHEMPECAAFEVFEPDEFLTYVRRSRGIPDPPPKKD